MNVPPPHLLLRLAQRQARDMAVRHEHREEAREWRSPRFLDRIAGDARFARGTSADTVSLLLSVVIIPPAQRQAVAGAACVATHTAVDGALDAVWLSQPEPAMSVWPPGASIRQTQRCPGAPAAAGLLH